MLIDYGLRRSGPTSTGGRTGSGDATVGDYDRDRSELFVVGRLDKKGRRVVFVNEPAKAPFPGPWELHAVFTL